MGFFDDRERGDLGPPPEPFRIGGDTPEFRSPVPLRWIGAAAAILVGFIVLSVLKSIYVDVLWFESVGFRERVPARAGGAGDAVLRRQPRSPSAVLGGNIFLARRLAPTGPEESFIEEIDVVALRRIVTVVLIAGTLFLGVIFGSVAGGSWETILSWLNGVSFGRDDPAFNRDISFYMFDMPAFQLIQGWFLGLLIVSTHRGTGAVYALSLSLQGFELNVTRGMRIHLSMLVGIILLLIALSTYLSIFELVLSPGGIVYGATYTDINARLPVRYILIALALFAGLATMANAFLSTGQLPRTALRVRPVGDHGISSAGIIYPNFVQSFQVDPNEREREEKFIARNIEATRLRLRARRHHRERLRRGAVRHRGRARGEPADARQRPLARPAAAPRHVQPGAGDPPVLLVQRRRRGPLCAQRAGAPGDAVAARELDISRAQERNWTRGATPAHTRLRRRRGAGQRGHSRRGCPTSSRSDIPPVSDTISI